MSRSGKMNKEGLEISLTVLIPLLVDVPLWVLKNHRYYRCCFSLNPSFSGCPALGCILDVI